MFSTGSGLPGQRAMLDAELCARRRPGVEGEGLAGDKQVGHAASVLLPGRGEGRRRGGEGQRLRGGKRWRGLELGGWGVAAAGGAVIQLLKTRITIVVFAAWNR